MKKSTKSKKVVKKQSASKKKKVVCTHKPNNKNKSIKTSRDDDDDDDETERKFQRSMMRDDNHLELQIEKEEFDAEKEFDKLMDEELEDDDEFSFGKDNWDVNRDY